MKSRAVAVALSCALALALASCGAEQDPGVDPGTSQGAPRTTSNTLPPCPAAGTPVGPAGCLDTKGNVTHP
jgi:hypothetical protein